MKIKFLGHSSVKIISENGTIIFFDPYKISDDQSADLILISHSHFDHNSAEDINELRKEDTIIIGPRDVAKDYKGARSVEENTKLVEKDIEIKAVPAYNVEKEYHPRGVGVGYIIKVDNKNIYFAGDTDNIPEMRDFKDIDIAFLPVGGTYTMNAEEAAYAARTIRPKLAIPIHYGSVVGNKMDPIRFREICDKLNCSCEVKIL